jgi:hypothetical protein
MSAMAKIKGLDQLQRQLADAQRAFQVLDGQVASVQFNPADATSVQEAIRTVEQTIDAKVAPYRTNPLVAQIIPQLKEKYRTALLDRAAKAMMAT